MDHAEARTRLSDLAAEPGRLRRFNRADNSDSPELREHLAGCAECRADLDAWRSTIAALDTAVGTAPTDGAEPAGSLRELAAYGGRATLPAGLRARTLALTQQRSDPVASRISPHSPVSSIESGRRSLRLPAWLAIAAAVVILIAGGAVIVDRTQQLNYSRSDLAALQTVTAGLDRVLQDPGYRVAVLTTAAGTTGGSVAWSRSEGYVVVLASSLQSPPAGQTYRCYVIQGGSRVAVGEMWFSGSLAYWVGNLDSWGPAQPGSRFSVNLEPTSAGSTPVGTPVLTGTL
jgi:hypothetical protein